MPTLIQGVKNTVNRVLGKTRAKDTNFHNLDHDDKLSVLFRDYRTEDPVGRQMLNRTWFRSALYYAGKQQVAWNGLDQTLEVFDPIQGEDWYAENQFRKDVWSNAAAMLKASVAPSVAPASDRPDDVAAARVGNSALEVVRDDIGQDSNDFMKFFFMCLFGSSFKFNTFIKNGDQHGITILPKFKYEESEMPGMAICSNPECGNTTDAALQVAGPQKCEQCGNDMQQIAAPQSITSKVEDGFSEEENGRNVEIVTGPLEMYMRTKVTHGLGYQPYLFWVRRLDADIVYDARPQTEELMQITRGGLGSRYSTDATGEDLGQWYISVLSSLTGGPYEAGYLTSDGRRFREVEYAMCWIRPEAFRGDDELKKLYPHGVAFETCNGQYIPETAQDQSMDDHWTHYQYLVNPYSAWGDGMVDALPVQDQLNETNSLITRHLRYSTVGKKLYDQNIITPAWLSNNPEEAWIPGNVPMDKTLRDSVFEINPTPLSQDVAQWKQSLYGTMQDMTHAYNAIQGKSSGANTPYSADVFQAEQAMGWFLPMFKFNSRAVIQCTRQQLKLFRENTSEQRVRKFKDNTGKWSYEKFSGSDLSSGSFDIYISDTEGQPKSKADRLRGLELYTNLSQIMPTLSQKQRVYVLDQIGMPPDANPDTLMTQKAYRDIETITKKGQDVTPNPFILDIPVYVKTIKEFLVGEQGDDLAEENPQLWAKVFALMFNVMLSGQQMAAGMPPMEQQPQGAPGQPSQQQQGPPQQEFAQSPVPEGQRQPMPPLPAGARQGSQV